MSGILVLDWAILAVSLYNTIVLFWLGLTVLLNARHKNWSVWLAGGGLKRGVVHGATDEIGFHASEDRHYVTDIHATILRQLGLDSRRLELPGRKRLDIDHGRAIEEIIA